MLNRRCFFILISIVLVYVCGVIILVVMPLQKSASVRGLRRIGLNQYSPNVQFILHWCQPLRWHVPVKSSVVALASHPGSGNTWLRYLLQQVTGVYTGSIYLDYSLVSHGFPGENVTDGSVLVVKTHEGPPKDDRFAATILLVRNPMAAIQADFNRLYKGHIGTVPRRAYLAKDVKISWPSHVTAQTRGWEAFHRDWLVNFRKPIHVVLYRSLVEDTENTLYGILKFLGQNVSKETMKCTINNQEGIYRRKRHINFDPYTEAMKISIKQTAERVSALVKQRMVDSDMSLL